MVTTTAVTARISIATNEKIERLAEDMGLTRGEWFKELLGKIDRNDIEVVAIEPDQNAHTIKLEAKVELLAAEKERLETKLLEANREGSLAGIETKQKSLGTLVNERVEAYEQKRKTEDLEKELLALRQEKGVLQAKADELETRANWLGFAERMATISPKLTEKMAGLIGLDITDTNRELAGADTEALNIGQSILNNFNSEQMPLLKGILTFFMQNHGELEKIAHLKQIKPYWQN